MKRRQALISLLGAGAVSLDSEAAAQALSPDAVRGMFRNLAQVELLPGEEREALAFLLSMRQTVQPNPETEPAITFEP